MQTIGNWQSEIGNDLNRQSAIGNRQSILYSQTMLKFRNTLSGRVEEFHPLKEGEAKFYYCGPTVWNYGHIGNFRSAVAADILRRYLKSKGFKVTHVMNITDA